MTDPSSSAATRFTVGTVRDLPAAVGTEASGLIRLPGGDFLTMGDGTGDNRLSQLDADGTFVRTIMVRTRNGAAPTLRNVEALSLGPCRDGTCVFIGDIGDNDQRRVDITVYRTSLPAAGATEVVVTDLTYTYPDGPHNAETLMIDTAGRPVIVTKPDGGVAAHRIYRGATGGGKLTLVNMFRPPTPIDPTQSLFTGTVATDGSFDGHRVLLLTYDQVIDYVAPPGRADLATFTTWPHHELPFTHQDQAEGITGLADGCGYAVASEAGPLGERSTFAQVTCG